MASISPVQSPRERAQVIPPTDEELLDAVDDVDLALIQSCIELGANLHCIDEDPKQTPLMIAAQFGRLKMVLMFLTAGVDVNQQVEGKTALQEALCEGEIEIVHVLIRNGAVLPAFDQMNVFLSEVLGRVHAAFLMNPENEIERFLDLAATIEFLLEHNENNRQPLQEHFQANPEMLHRWINWVETYELPRREMYNTLVVPNPYLIIPNVARIAADYHSRSLAKLYDHLIAIRAEQNPND